MVNAQKRFRDEWLLLHNSAITLKEWFLCDFFFFQSQENLIKLPRWLSGKEFACQCRSRRKHSFYPWVGKIPWKRKRQPSVVFLLDNQSQTQLSTHIHNTLISFSDRSLQNV